MYAHEGSKFFAPPSLRCPNCSMPMRLTAITPCTGRQQADEIIYRCHECSSDIKFVAGPADDIFSSATFAAVRN
jgi:DNA-directed RNA polymerase subunit RPC12/RpoP